MIDDHTWNHKGLESWESGFGGELNVYQCSRCELNRIDYIPGYIFDLMIGKTKTNYLSCNEVMIKRILE